MCQCLSDSLHLFAIVLDTVYIPLFLSTGPGLSEEDFAFWGPVDQGSEGTTLDRPAELFTSCGLGVFCTPAVSAYENAKIQNMNVNISPTYFAVCLLSSPENPLFWVFGGTCVSLVIHTAIVLVSVWCVVQSRHWILRQFKAKFAFTLQSMNFHRFFRSSIEIIVRLLSLRTKSNGFQMKTLTFQKIQTDF